MKRIISLLLLAASLLCTAACSEVGAVDLMTGITPSVDIAPFDANDTESAAALADFGVRLLRHSATDGESTLISPLSVISALAMCANGADGDTLTEIETVLGMTCNKLNEYVGAYIKELSETEKYSLSLANSIWFTDDERFTVNESFLQTNADYYGADIYKAPFDTSTLSDINRWVSDKTDGMIPKVLESIPNSTVMYLINALVFDAEWQSVYERHQVHERTFTREDGTTRKAELMYSYEYRYIEDENAVGFIKYYSKSRYAFAALLPNEGVSIGEYVGTLTGEGLISILDNASDERVYTAIPKFELDYSAELADILSKMGMPSAFDEDGANLSHLGSSTAGNISITRVIHKTRIEVGERGTKAGAATVIEAGDGAAAVSDEDPKEVILNRPFVYMIIDCETNLPLFIGTLTDVT